MESTTALLAELARRQEEGERPACGSAQGGDYNTPAHVGALVLILVLSIAGTNDTRNNFQGAANYS